MNNDRLQAAAQAHAAKTNDPGTVGFHRTISAFRRGAEWLLSQPLADRLTQAERSKIAAFLDGRTSGDLDFSQITSCQQI